MVTEATTACEQPTDDCDEPTTLDPRNVEFDPSKMKGATKGPPFLDKGIFDLTEDEKYRELSWLRTAHNMLVAERKVLLNEIDELRNALRFQQTLATTAVDQVGELIEATKSQNVNIGNALHEIRTQTEFAHEITADVLRLSESVTGHQERERTLRAEVHNLRALNRIAAKKTGSGDIPETTKAVFEEIEGVNGKTHGADLSNKVAVDPHGDSI